MKPIDTERFYVFSSLVDGIHKSIHRLKSDFAAQFGIKNVHLFWIYELSVYPEGLTAAELAAKAMISRSLVSREMEMLLEDGYIKLEEQARGKRKNYNSRITLTEKGRDLAEQIRKKAKTVQDQVSRDVSLEDLAHFYETIEKLFQNIQTISFEADEENQNRQDRP